MPYLAPVLSDTEVAKVLRITVERFKQIRTELEGAGFPEPLAPIDRWLRKEVERWLDRQADRKEWWASLSEWPSSDQ